MSTRDEYGRPLVGFALAILAAGCWAVNGLLANWLFATSGTSSWRIAVPANAIDSRVLAADRAMVATIVLGFTLAALDRKAFRIRLTDLPFLGVFGLVGLAGVQYTYYRTIEVTGQPAVAILLEYLAPVIVLVFSVSFLGERFTWALPAGVGLAVGGCALVVGIVGSAEGMTISREGLAWGLVSAMFFAAYSLLGRYGARKYGPWTVLVWGLASASVAWLLVLGAPAMLAPLRDPVVFGAVVFSAVVGTIVPFGAYLFALRIVDATKVSVTAALEPVLVALGGWVLFAQGLTATQLAGGLLVVAAIAAVQTPVRAPVLPPRD